MALRTPILRARSFSFIGSFESFVLVRENRNLIVGIVMIRLKDTAVMRMRRCTTGCQYELSVIGSGARGRVAVVVVDMKKERSMQISL